MGIIGGVPLNSLLERTTRAGAERPYAIACSSVIIETMAKRRDARALGGQMMFSEPGPAPRGQAWRAVARCAGASLVMLVRRRVHLPRRHVGRVLRFADGSTARVYRETTVDRRPPVEPCVLVVAFRLRLIRGRRMHRAFEAESLLNTPLFVGFPGYVSKLWCTHDGSGVYRGLYEWDGPQRARQYAASLWRVLELGSVPGSIRYQVVPGLHRDDVLADPNLMSSISASDDAWWRLVAVS
jgi:hypothetical protein